MPSPQGTLSSKVESLRSKMTSRLQDLEAPFQNATSRDWQKAFNPQREPWPFCSGATQQKNLIPVLICLALAILTVITFWSLKDCGFINFDDQMYVYENAYVQSGLNSNSIGQAFSSAN